MQRGESEMSVLQMYVCDRCKKKSNQTELLKVEIKAISKKNHMALQQFSIDLCEECAKAVNLWEKKIDKESIPETTADKLYDVIQDIVMENIEP